MDTRKPDIFDRLMHLPVLNIFEPFYKKHKEMLLYLFFRWIDICDKCYHICLF